MVMMSPIGAGEAAAVFKGKVADLLNYGLGMGQSEGIATYGEARSKLNTLAAQLATETFSDIALGSSARARINSLISALGLDGEQTARWDFAGGRYWVDEPVTVDAAATCVRASSGYALDAAGQWVAFAANEPRITDRGLLVEPARTNLCLWSNDLSNAAYVLTSGATKTSNVMVAPDGTMTGDMLTYGDATLAFQAYQIIPVSEGTQYTYSYYARLGTKLRNRHAIYNNTAGAWIVSEVVAGGVTSGAWTRVAVTFTTPPGCSGIRVYPDRFTANLDGPTGSTIYIWGQQLEAALVASSPIVTTSVPVTRAADVVTLDLPPGTHDLAYTFDDNSAQEIAGQSGAYVIPTNLNRRVIKSITAMAA